MKKATIPIVIAYISVVSVWAGDLDALCGKLPEDTFVFVATEGYSNFKSDFENSTIGQIAADPQVKDFFEQLLTSISKIDDLKTVTGQGEEDREFVRELLAVPTVLAIVPISNTFSEEPYGLLLREPIIPNSRLETLFQDRIKKYEGKIVRKEVKGCEVFVSSDQNASESFYIASTKDFFIIGFNDDQYTMLEHLRSNPYNEQIAEHVRLFSSTHNALVMYADFQKLMQMARQEAATDPDVRQVLEVLDNLGLGDIQYYLFKAGFEGKNLNIDGKISTSVSTGIWDAIRPVDKSLFDHIDPKAMQASAVYINPACIYDTIMNCMNSIMPAQDNTLQVPIVQIEQQVGFKIREDFLDSLEGSFMAYAMPAYANPELLTDGYVLTARLKDPEKFARCMSSLETFMKSIVPAQQLQISSQKTASDKELHIWAVSVMAMMQVIPSWTVQGDTLIITSHPAVARKVIQRIASRETLSISNPEFASAISQVPGDAFTVSLADSKMQARQLMKALQQSWPMLNMMLVDQDVQLPIMLPSIEPYIEQMTPGLSYTRKASDGIEFHYEGTGLEVSSVAVAGGAAGVAVLMPALSKTKQIAQRTVSGTNLKAIGTACVIYANDYNDQYPSDLQILVAEYDLSPKTLESPRKPDGFDGPSYIILHGLTGMAPASAVLAYENPDFCDDGKVNVLYVDGYVAAEEKDQLKLALRKTYEYLRQPIPKMEW